MNARAAKRLYDAKQAATQVIEYASGKTLDGFLAEEMWRFAVERQAGRLASAVAASVREAPELAERLPGWERVANLSACLSLDAEEGDIVRMGKIVTVDVPPMLAAIEGELERYGPPPVEVTSNTNPVIAGLIETHRAEIAELCQDHQVAMLHVFGSAATGEFSDESDVDFLVTWNPSSKKSFERSLDLETALSDLLGREIDLVDDKEFDNPYFQHSVMSTRVPLYRCEMQDEAGLGRKTERDSSRCSE